MPENKTSSFRMKRELVHINQAFFSSPRYTHPLNYESKPLALLKPKIQAQGSGKEGNTSAKINVSYSYSPDEILLIAIWNQCEILLSHHEGTPFSTEETHEFYTNLGLFKAHSLTPEHDGIFFIGDDYMYLVAVCWCRWLDSLSEEVRKELNLATLRETLHTQISRYTPNKREFPLLFKDEVSMEEVVADLEYRFKKIYHDHKERVDNISDNQLRVYTALRCLGYLLALSLLVTAFSVMAPSVELAILCIFLSPAVAVGAHLGTRVNATVSQQSVQENNMKYHESQSAIAKEFPDWEPRTTDELIAECEKPQERELMCYLQ